MIHPDDELGLACLGVWSDVSSASREYPACIPAGTPVYQPVQPDSPASNQPEYAMLLLPSPPLPPTRPGEPAAAGEAAVDTARSPRGQRPTSPQHARFRSASTGTGLRPHPSKARPHSRPHTPTDAAAIARIVKNAKQEKPSCETIVNYKKGGVKFLNQVQIKPLYDENDELAAFMSMLTEVDESEQA